MTYQELIEKMDPAVYRNLRRAVELGKWPDGRAVTPKQRETCMEAVIWYENHHNLPEHDRVGYIAKERKEGNICDTPSDVQPLHITGGNA